MPLSLCEKPPSKQQGLLLSKSWAHDLRSARLESCQASGHKRQGYCCHGRINFLASCPTITMILFLTILLLACGHPASGPNLQTNKDKRCAGLCRIATKSVRLAQAGLASGEQSETWGHSCRIFHIVWMTGQSFPHSCQIHWRQDLGRPHNMLIPDSLPCPLSV